MSFSDLKVLVLLGTAFAAVVSTSDLKLTVSQKGEFSVSAQGTEWLKSNGIWINSMGARCSNADGSLILTSWDTDKGRDALDSWNSEIITFRCNHSASDQFQAIFKAYDNMPVIAFGQRYLIETTKASSGDVKKVASAFPTFRVPDDKEKSSQGFNDVLKFTDSPDLGYYAINGYMAGDDSKSFGRWNTKSFKSSNGQHMGPLALFTTTGQVMIVSPFTNFMASSIWYDKTKASLQYGFLGKAEVIPNNSELWTMIHYSKDGINKAFSSWGQVMKKYYKSQNEEFAEGDFTLNYLGYWTDNGAFYYYNTEKNKTYEQTVFDIQAYSKSLNVPYTYIQYDSWFYPKGKGTGLLDWVPDVKNFPDGLHYVQNKTGWPVAAHCKWWSPQTPLAKQNGGKYDFIIEHRMALPIDQQLWLDILKAARQWNIIMFEQDWLGQMFDGLSILQTNVTIGRQWMLQMAEGVMQNGLVMEQCTAYPRHTLMGLEIPVVTQQRVTMDYQLTDNNWRTGVNSLWVYSLGQIPYKDIFWTTPVQHCPKYPKAKHPYVELDALVASLTAGPIGPSDGINMTNAALLMRCCNADGLILKPDRPATAIDAQFYESAFGSSFSGPQGEVWTTSSEISNFFFGIIFAADLTNSYSIGPNEAGFPTKMGQTAAFDRNRLIYAFGNDSKIKLHNCSRGDFCLFYTTPVFNVGQKQFILLGETSKWIPLSNNRILSIEPSEHDIVIKMQGAIGEKVEFWIAADSTLSSINCVMTQSRRTAISVMSKTCRSL